MLTTPITLDYAGASVTLHRINQDNNASKYYGKLADGVSSVTLTIQHTIPKKKGSPGEAHLVRFDVEHFDVAGVYQRTSTAWSVIRTNDGVQDDASSEDVALALCTFLSANTAANLVAVLARRS